MNIADIPNGVLWRIGQHLAKTSTQEEIDRVTIRDMLNGSVKSRSRSDVLHDWNRLKRIPELSEITDSIKSHYSRGSPDLPFHLAGQSAWELAVGQKVTRAALKTAYSSGGLQTVTSQMHRSIGGSKRAWRLWTENVKRLNATVARYDRLHNLIGRILSPWITSSRLAQDYIYGISEPYIKESQIVNDVCAARNTKSMQQHKFFSRYSRDEVVDCQEVVGKYGDIHGKCFLCGEYTDRIMSGVNFVAECSKHCTWKVDFSSATEIDKPIYLPNQSDHQVFWEESCMGHGVFDDDYLVQLSCGCVFEISYSDSPNK